MRDRSGPFANQATKDRTLKEGNLNMKHLDGRNIHRLLDAGAMNYDGIFMCRWEALGGEVVPYHIRSSAIERAYIAARIGFTITIKYRVN